MTGYKQRRGFYLYGVLLPILLTMQLLSYGCRAPLTRERLLRRIERTSRNLRSYHSILESEIYGELRQRFYVEIWHLAPSYYRVEIESKWINSEVEGSKQIFIADGEDVWFYHPELGEFYLLHDLVPDDKYPPFLLQSHWETLFSAQKITILGIEKKEKQSHYLIEVVPAEPVFNHAYEKLWLEARTLLPARIEIYGQNDLISRVITFKQTELNLEIDPALFDPDAAIG